MAKTREEYTACMRPYMTGGGEDKRERFCIGAKICSGKAENEPEAKNLCEVSALEPKPPKKPKKEKICQLKDLAAVGACLAANIDLSSLTPSNMQQTFEVALQKCTSKQSASVKRLYQKAEDMDARQLEALKTIAKIQQQSGASL